MTVRVTVLVTVLANRVLGHWADRLVGSPVGSHALTGSGFTLLYDVAQSLGLCQRCACPESLEVWQPLPGFVT